MGFMALASLHLLAASSRPITPGPIKESQRLLMITAQSMWRSIHRQKNIGR